MDELVVGKQLLGFLVEVIGEHRVAVLIKIDVLASGIRSQPWILLTTGGSMAAILECISVRNARYGLTLAFM